MKRLVGIGFIAGCAYHGGAFSDIHGTFEGQRRTIGCLDISVARVDDGGAPVVSYAFGNRCRYPVPLDFSAVRVHGRGADGAVHELVAFDPNHEIHPLAIDALITGRENIEYVAQEPMSQICVDLSGITTGAGETVCQ